MRLSYFQQAKSNEPHIDQQKASIADTSTMQNMFDMINKQNEVIALLQQHQIEQDESIRLLKEENLRLRTTPRTIFNIMIG